MDLREGRGLAYSIGAGIERAGDRTLCVAAAGTRSSQVDEMAEGMRGVRAGLPPEPEAAALQREAHAIYGSELRRQESRLNQAMEAVWSARATGDPLAWWTETTAVLDATPAAVGPVLRSLAAADETGRAIRVVVR
jgi:predicted Zn-dependent peptidase